MMQTKRVCYTEAAYLLGLVLLAFGAAWMERADLGMSMVVAPAYLLHLKISEIFPWYSFGMSEYVLQAVLLLVLSAVLRKFKKSYLFSFVTAVLYGVLLDLAIGLVGLLPPTGMVWRIVFYVAGVLLCSVGVALLFHTYIPPEAYELFVKELAATHHWRIHRAKTVYDCCSCLVGVILSFCFFGFGHFEGVKIGTLLCAAINGFLIGRISGYLEARFTFRDRLPFRGAFEK